MKKILVVVGTRPNFIKITQFRKEVEKFSNIELRILHTGQHSDENMAQIFFSQFGLQPDFFLNINNHSPLTQMGQILYKLEELVNDVFTPDLIITPGDVNSTLAVALTANKLGIPLAHLESGLRSYDRTMPEEINRVLTDEISDLYFVTEKSGVENLKIENKIGKIHFVGNTMIDTLVNFQEEINNSSILNDLKITGEFALITIHRPSNVDSKCGLLKLVRVLSEISKNYKVIFPIHPRTCKNLQKFSLFNQVENLQNVKLTEALGYFEFQKLIKSCTFVLTDSGGIQEETTYQNIPCLTVRENTERPITMECGTNSLIPFEVDTVLNEIDKIKKGLSKKGEIPPLWDGKATARIIQICSDFLEQ